VLFRSSAANSSAAASSLFRLRPLLARMSFFKSEILLRYCQFPRSSPRNSGYDGVLDVYENNGFGLNGAYGDCFRVHVACLNRKNGPMGMITVLSGCI
jgi:hypothetical protein